MTPATATGSADPDPTDDALVSAARRILDGQRYLVLASTGLDGTARVSPVYFTHHHYGSLFWVSSQAATHSANLNRDPRVSAVVFDSTLPPSQTEAVFITGTAHEVPESDLENACQVAFATVGEGAVAFTPAEVSGPAELRLYRADTATIELHVRGHHPLWGNGVDRRVRVEVQTS